MSPSPFLSLGFWRCLILKISRCFQININISGWYLSTNVSGWYLSTNASGWYQSINVSGWYLSINVSGWYLISSWEFHLDKSLSWSLIATGDVKKAVSNWAHRYGKRSQVGCREQSQEAGFQKTCLAYFTIWCTPQAKSPLYTRKSLISQTVALFTYSAQFGKTRGRQTH